MKKIKLPIGNTSSISFDSQCLSSDNISGDGNSVHIGTIYPQKDVKELIIARENGGQVIWAATEVEQNLESLLIDYLFDRPMGRPNRRRDFFENKILKTSFFSYQTKKNLTIQVISELKLLTGKKLNSLQKLLKNIMDYRNAFAHGHLHRENSNLVKLEFFSGRPKVDVLTEEYWCILEKEFEKTNELLKEVTEKLDSIQLQGYLNKIDLSRNKPTSP